MGLRDPVVCVVGAGPAGLVTAHLLWRAGISFVVLERQEAHVLCARVKAGLIEHRTVELLGPHGLAGPILGRGGQVGMIEFRADGHAFVLDYRPSLPQESWHRSPPTLSAMVKACVAPLP